MTLDEEKGLNFRQLLPIIKVTNGCLMIWLIDEIPLHHCKEGWMSFEGGAALHYCFTPLEDFPASNPYPTKISKQCRFQNYLLTI
jgi:hypothetical protein